MKRLLPFVIVFAVVLSVVPFALANGKPGGGSGQKNGKNKFEAVGTLTAVDAAAWTVTVKIKACTKSIKSLRGTDVTFVVDAGAKVRLVTADGCVAAALADLPLGQKAKVSGKIDRTDPAAPVYVLKSIKVNAPDETPTP